MTAPGDAAGDFVPEAICSRCSSVQIVSVRRHDVWKQYYKSLENCTSTEPANTVIKQGREYLHQMPSTDSGTVDGSMHDRG